MSHRERARGHSRSRGVHDSLGAATDAQREARPLHVHIGSLILHGFERTDSAALASGLETELAHAWGSAVAPSALAALHGRQRLDAGEFHVQRGSRGFAVGRQVARALHRAFARERR